MKPSDYKYAVDAHFFSPLNISIESNIYCVEYSIIDKNINDTVPLKLIQMFLEGFDKNSEDISDNEYDMRKFSINRKKQSGIVICRNRKNDKVILRAYSFDKEMLEVVNAMIPQCQSAGSPRPHIEIKSVYPAYLVKPIDEQENIQKENIKRIECTIKYCLESLDPENVNLNYQYGNQCLYKDCIMIISEMNENFVNQRKSQYKLDKLIDKSFGSTIKKYCKFKLFDEKGFQKIYNKMHVNVDPNEYKILLENIYKFIQEKKVEKAEELLLKNGVEKSMYTHNFTKQLFG